jgi:glutathione S-transferase
VALQQQQQAAAYIPSARPAGGSRYSTSKTSRSSSPVGKWASYSAPVRKKLFPRLFRRKPKSKNIELTFHDIPAVAGEKVRLALALAGVKFNDNRVSSADWPKLKPSTKYGRLPGLKVDGVEKYQSGSLLRWAGTLGGGSLYPVHDVDKFIKIEELLGLSEDFQREFQPALFMERHHTRYGHPADWAEKDTVVQKMREKFLEKALPKFMGSLSRELEQTGAFLTGKKPTIADCQWLPQLDSITSGSIQHIPRDILKDYPLITAWMERMKALPRVSKYYLEVSKTRSGHKEDVVATEASTIPEDVVATGVALEH